MRRRQQTPASTGNKKAITTLSECDVVSVFFYNFETWLDARGKRFGEFLAKYGISHDFMLSELVNAERDIARAIERTNCKIVINELCVAPPAIVERLARRFSAVKFISLGHAAPCYESASFNHSDRLFAHQVLSTRAENVYFGTVMSRNRFADVTGSKVVELPNFIDMPAIESPPQVIRPLSLSMIGRQDVVKGQPSAISALARLSKSREIHAFITTSKEAQVGIAKLVHEGVSHTFLKWGDWRKMLNNVANFVDIGIQLSLTESFNLVAIEHMTLGKPVVGTVAIEYLPKSWQANPQDPESAVKAIEMIANNYDRESKRAKTIAEKVAGKCNKTLIKNLKQLIK